MTHLVTSNVTAQNELELDKARKLTAGAGITLTDGGAGGDLTIASSSAVPYDDSDISNPPTQEEISAALGAPFTVGRGYVRLLDDGGLGLREYLAVSDGNYWNVLPLARVRSGLAYDSLTRYGDILTGTGAEESTVAEPSVLIENGQWKMWYRYGWNTPLIGYATSPDGITWTKYAGNPVIATNLYCPSVFKLGSTYHLYAALSTWDSINHYTSTDGIAWTLAQAGAITPGSSGAWDDFAVANTFVWSEGENDYRMLYEAKNDAGGAWKLGYATSTDGNSWTKSGSNPVISITGSIGGPWLLKSGSTYYLWAHRSATGALPTDIALYHSTNLTSWTDDGLQLSRSGSDEGSGVSVGQVADAFIVIRNGVMYLYYIASSDGDHTTGGMHIKLATAKEALVYGD